MKIEEITHKILIAAVSAISAANIGYIFSSFLLTPEYSSTSRYYVIEENDNGEETGYIKKSADNYVHFFSSYAFFDKVAEDSQLEYTNEQLSNMITVSAIESSSFLDITVKADNPSDTFQIQQSILKKQESYLHSVTDGTITASLIDQARIPSSPSSPHTLLIVLCFSAIGALGGAGAAFFFSRSDNHIQSISDITTRFSYPVLSCIPSVSNVSLSHIKSHQKYSDINSYSPLLINDRTNVNFTDAFRKLSSNLKRTLPDRSCKVLTVSSAVAQEGKTTVSVNLAVTIAQSGARVLIIECDLRNGKIRNFFGIHGNQPGISNVVYGTLSSKDVIVLTEYDSLFVLCAGTVLHNPVSLLSSPDMSDTVSQLKPMFDYIIIDTPPVNAVSDVLTLTQLSDGLIIVARQNHTMYDDIEKAVKSFELADTNISGFILNDADDIYTHKQVRHMSNNFRFKQVLQNNNIV